MQEYGRLKILLVLSALVLFFAGNFLLWDSGDLSGKIAFLKNGEVWVSDSSGKKMRQITSDSGKVDDFRFSPSLRYLAYARIIRFEDEPGLWEDTGKVPQRPVSSIKIMNLATGTIIKEIIPTGDPWLSLSKWLPGEKLYYYSSSGFDVSGFTIYDVQKNLTEESDYSASSSIWSTEYSADGSLKAYVDDSGLGKEFRMNLHLVNAGTNTDRILVSRRNIADHRLAYDLNRIALVEVEDVEKTYYDILWIFNIKGNTLKQLYRESANPKSAGTNGLSWSFDDRYIGMFFPPNATVIEAANPDNRQRIQGSDFCWISNDRIVFARGGDTYLYDTDTGRSALLFEGASKPAFLGTAGQ